MRLRSRGFLLCLAILATVLLAADPVGSVNTKKGVGYTLGPRYLVPELGSWVRTWDVDGSAWEAYDVHFFPTIEKAPLVDGFVPEPYLETLRVEARRNPGACWIYGKEPDGMDPGSDYWAPGEAMIAWPHVRGAILEVDPTACFIFGNVVWVSYVGYTGAWWLEYCLALEPNLRSQIDAWGIHLYAEWTVDPYQWWAACRDGDCVSEEEMETRYRNALDYAVDWSMETGGGLPIYLTEWGQLRNLCQGFTCDECSAGLKCDYREMLMRRFMPWFDREPMIAGYAWFATRTDSCPQDWCACCDGALVAASGLKPLGELYARPYRLRLSQVFSGFNSPLH